MVGRILNDKAVIAVKNLNTGYSRNVPVLKNVSFNVQQGELIGIIGPNGAGKSTLLKTLRGLLPPIEGTVEINGRLTTELTDREFACNVAYLQQSVELTFGYSNKEIVMAGRYPRLQWWQRESAEDEKIVEACMEYTGVENLMDKPANAISGGQRQRVLLAKVLAQQTPILFLDEPSTGLDIFYQEEIYRFCRELCAAGKTVLMVVHEMSLAGKFCSRLMLVGQNKILADGTPEEVLTGENLSRAYRVPVDVVTNPLTGTKEVYTEPLEADEHRRGLLRTIIGEGGK